VKKCEFWEHANIHQGGFCKEKSLTVSRGVCKNCPLNNGEANWHDYYNESPFNFHIKPDIELSKGLGLENFLDIR
jgi:hypothetical protein